MYEQETLVSYRQRLPSGRRPREALLDFAHGDFAGPLTALESLSDEGRMLFTEAALAAETDLAPWEFFHETNRDGYPIMEVEAPLIWRIRDEGRLRTSRGPQPVAACLAPSLAEWASAMPVAEVSDELAELLHLPTSLDAVPEHTWRSALEAAHSVSDDGVLGRLYLEASRRIDDPPEHLRCRIGQGFGPAPAALVTVVHDHRELNALIPQKVPTLLVLSIGEAEELRSSWRLNAEQKVETSLAYSAVGEATPLFDQFPALQWHVEPDAPNLILVPCDELRLETSTDAGQETEDTAFFVSDGHVYFDHALDQTELLEHLAGTLGLAADAHLIDEILTRGAESERRRRTAEIRGLPEESARSARRGRRARVAQQTAERTAGPTRERRHSHPWRADSRTCPRCVRNRRPSHVPERAP